MCQRYFASEVLKRLKLALVASIDEGSKFYEHVVFITTVSRACSISCTCCFRFDSEFCQNTKTMLTNRHYEHVFF